MSDQDKRIVDLAKVDLAKVDLAKVDLAKVDLAKVDFDEIARMVQDQVGVAAGSVLGSYTGVDGTPMIAVDQYANQTLHNSEVRGRRFSLYDDDIKRVWASIPARSTIRVTALPGATTAMFVTVRPENDIAYAVNTYDFPGFRQIGWRDLRGDEIAAEVAGVVAVLALAAYGDATALTAEVEVLRSAPTVEHFQQGYTATAGQVGQQMQGEQAELEKYASQMGYLGSLLGPKR